jgi:hypothetical protein
MVLSGQTTFVAPPPEVQVPHPKPPHRAQRGAVAGRDPLKPKIVKRKIGKVQCTTQETCVKKKDVCLPLLSSLCTCMCLEVSACYTEPKMTVQATTKVVTCIHDTRFFFTLFQDQHCSWSWSHGAHCEWNCHAKFFMRCLP